MADRDRIVAVGLLTEQELALLGQRLTRVYPIDSSPCFDDLLRAIDRAEETAANPRVRAPGSAQ